MKPVGKKKKMKAKTATYETLTIENAHKASTVININNPEWGNKRFNHNEQPLMEGRVASTVGTGCNSSVLFEGEYKFWGIVTYKQL